MGTYVRHEVERPGGTCGTLSDQVEFVDSTKPGSVGTGCAGSIALSSDQCTETPAFSCNRTDNAGPFTDTYKGSVTWSKDGASALGVLERDVVYASGAACTSLYDVSLARQ